MTIRHGELHVVEALSEFKHDLNVDNKELIDSLNGKQQEQLVEIENETRLQNEHKITTDELDQVSRDSLNHLTNELLGTNEIIKTVLEARDTEYTHIYEPPVHRIIELHPE